MANSPKPLRRRAKREAPGVARGGLGVGLTGRLLGAGAQVCGRDDCGHEVLALPTHVHYEMESCDDSAPQD